MDKTPIGYVYETKNHINGMFYIGIRWKRGGKFAPSYLGSGLYLKRAITHYGRLAFSVRLLQTASSLEDLGRLERELITAYRAEHGRKMVYNITEGGRGGAKFGNKHGLGHRLSPEHRASIAAAQRNRIQSTETRAKRAVSMRGNTNGAGGKGKVISPEAKAKMSLAKAGKPWSLARQAAYQLGALV